MKKFLLILILLILSGCTTYYTHPFKSTQQFYQDDGQCQGLGGQSCGHGWNGQSNLGNWACKKRVYHGCMLGNGWSEQ